MSYVYTRLVPRKRLLLNYLLRQQQVFPTGAGRVAYPRSETTVAYTYNRLVPRKKILLSLAAQLAYPTLLSVSGGQFLGTTTILGTGFGATQGTGSVTIAGVTQAVTSWSPTAITIGSTLRGTAKYGVPVLVSVTNGTGATGYYTYAAGLSPEAGWAYVNLTAINLTAAYRLVATPDLAIGDQVAYGNITPLTGTVTVNLDASFETNSLAQFFYFEVNDGTGWGPQALVTVITLLYTDLYLYIAQLVNAGMLVQPNVNWITSPTVPYGKVISVVPVGGTSVNLWTYVTINASLGLAVGVVPNLVPNVVNLQAYDAEKACWAAQLDVGQRIYAFSNTVPAGYVIGQTTAAGSYQIPGTTIQLTVSLGPPVSSSSTTSVPTILTH